MLSKKRFFGAVIGLLMIVASVLTVAADGEEASITTVQDAFADPETVYVAGALNQYPFEFYDQKTESYEGILPNVLKAVSERTGLRFTYINGSEMNDSRLQSAKNGQVELVTCVPESDSKLVLACKKVSSPIFSVDEDGRDVSYCFGFSEIASDELISSVEAELSQISKEELFQFSVSADRMTEEVSPLVKILVVVVSILGGAVIMLVILLLVRRRVRRQQLEELKKKGPDILERSIFDREYQRNVNDNTRAAYSVIYVGFDAETVNQHFGMAGIERQARFAEQILLDHLNTSDLVCKDGNNYVIAGVHGGKAGAGEWTTSILEVLNGEGRSVDFMSYYAGIYVLTHEAVLSEEQCIQNAKEAYYGAQEQNVECKFYSEELRKQVEMRDRLAADAVKALEEHQFKMYLQPTVNAVTRQIVGAEVLTRWDHPAQGLLHPGRYIDVLTNAGMVRHLDMYIFEACCEKLQEWRKKGISIYLSCNFTRNTIDSENFSKELIERAQKYDFDRSKLVVEITESTIDTNHAVALANAIDCHNAGFQIALDDVGYGATSFADLREYPIDMMKIDRSILLGMESRKGRALLHGMLDLAHAMGMKSLCEGIETEAQYNLIQSLNSDYVQGYYFYKPMPLEVVEEILIGHEA